jgi:hypothetical protein
LTGLIAGQRFCFSEDVQSEIERICKMLDGSFNIDEDIPKLREIKPEDLNKLL